MTETTQPVFSIEKIYVKDLSVEVPGAPEIFLVRETPQVNVGLRTEYKNVDEGIFEVTLHVNVQAGISEERALFLIELAQAGVFQIRHVPETELEPLMMIGCANILFPYARETVSDAITRAGFQPVLLAPVNFEALYQGARQEAQGGGE
jgi:preprotein translocase subunit SecB